MAKSQCPFQKESMSIPSRPAFAALLLCACATAHAQYAWIGPNGTRQYSDRPPPPGTPADKILKAPGRPAMVPPATPTPNQAGQAAAAPTLAAREADFRARAQSREEQERQRQQEAARQRRLAEHCEATREAQAALDSGLRIAQAGPDGQKSYMTDAERTARAERVRRALQECR